jgi:CheY-like chemotaxis protein
MSASKGSCNTAILYIEDDALTRQSITQRLLRRGFQVVQAASGEEALELVKDGPVPGTVLLDLELPGIDGLETYRRLRQLSPGLAAVVCTANLAAPARHDLLEMGIPEQCMLIKPCVFQDILDALERASGDASPD